MSDFDFAAHARAAVETYLTRRTFYDELAVVVRRIIEETLKQRKINVHSVQSRAKDATSFGKKAALPSDADHMRPKYENPIEQITDLAGVRVITFFPGTITQIDAVISQQFVVIERSNKGDDLIEEDRFGYQSIHYLVQLSPKRIGLPEYQDFTGSTTEIQVRTILQHAWAEIEHDIQYKSSSVIPTEIRRRFMALAGLFEIADREFQAIQDADQRLTDDAREKVRSGKLNLVEITPDSLKAFLDKRLGPDGRISDWSYDWTARLLKKLGFRTLEQIEKCVQGYDDDLIGRLLSGTRQGQTTRFEAMLYAGMGQAFIDRHLWADLDWWPGVRYQGARERMKEAGVEIRDYDPASEVNHSRQLRRLLLLVRARRQSDGAVVILVTNNHLGWHIAGPPAHSAQSSTAYLLPSIEDAGFDELNGAKYISEKFGTNSEVVQLTIDNTPFQSTKYNPVYDASTEYTFRFAKVRLVEPIETFQSPQPELPLRPHKFEWRSLTFLLAHEATKTLNSDVLTEMIKRFGPDLDGLAASQASPVPACADNE